MSATGIRTIRYILVEGETVLPQHELKVSPELIARLQSRQFFVIVDPEVNIASILNALETIKVVTEDKNAILADEIEEVVKKINEKIVSKLVGKPASYLLINLATMVSYILAITAITGIEYTVNKTGKKVPEDIVDELSEKTAKTMIATFALLLQDQADAVKNTIKKLLYEGNLVVQNNIYR